MIPPPSKRTAYRRALPPLWTIDPTPLVPRSRPTSQRGDQQTRGQAPPCHAPGAQILCSIHQARGWGRLGYSAGVPTSSHKDPARAGRRGASHNRSQPRNGLGLERYPARIHVGVVVVGDHPWQRDKATHKRGGEKRGRKKGKRIDGLVLLGLSRTNPPVVFVLWLALQS